MTLLRIVSFSGPLIWLIASCSGSSSQQTADLVGGAPGSGCETSAVDTSSLSGEPSVGGAAVSGGNGQNESGGASAVATTGLDSGPYFKEFSPDQTMATNTVYAANGVAISSTRFWYVENTGSSGTATVSIGYQGYTETLQVAVESGTRYVLGTKFAFANGTTTSCGVSSQLPGLSLYRNLASPITATSAGGTCTKVSGTTSSFLIPLSSCSCTEWFAIDGHARYTNCGLADPNCCNTCPSGKTCNNGMCF